MMKMAMWPLTMNNSFRLFLLSPDGSYMKDPLTFFTVNEVWERNDDVLPGSAKYSIRVVATASQYSTIVELSGGGFKTADWAGKRLKTLLSFLKKKE